MRLTIVIPCYREETVLPETTRRLTLIFKDLINNKKISSDSFFLFVNDGSPDKTWEVITRLHKNNLFVKGINLAANVGHQNALTAGLSVAKEYADVIISIDADLQDDVNVIPQMVDYYYEGYDIVYGVRKERKTDTFFKRTTALAFYKLMQALGVNSVYNHADYRLMSKRAVEQFCKYRERNLFIRGMIPLLGYKTANVYYNRAERYAGKSNYPFTRMLNFAIDGITSFSVKPVRMVLFIGLIFIIIALCIFTYVIVSYFSGNYVPGWSSIMISLWFVGGCVLFGIGIVGEYIGKIYIEVKDRPRYNIESVLMDNDNNDSKKNNS
jgi:polyisoprenyl-phosphate glycosyltransferase